MVSSATTSAVADPPESIIDLKNPGLAAFLAWLLPGAGHLYQGRTAKGLIFLVCILGTFLYGLYLGQGRVVFVYGAWRPEMFRWPYLCQMGAGLPALPAVVQAKLTDRPLFGGWYMPPGNELDFNALHKELHRYFELGTVFTMIAGLLNVLAIYDAYGGPAYASLPRRDDDAPQPKSGGEPAKT